MFSKTEFTGDYKGYDFIIQGKLHGKWYEMTEPYESDLKEFLQEIGDNEIEIGHYITIIRGKKWKVYNDMEGFFNAKEEDVMSTAARKGVLYLYLKN